MSNQKTYSGKELIKLLRKIGFEIIWIRGSHHYLTHIDGRGTVIPVHTNEDIGIGLFMKILKDVKISKEELNELI